MLNPNRQRTRSSAPMQKPASCWETGFRRCRLRAGYLRLRLREGAQLASIAYSSSRRRSRKRSMSSA